MSLVGLLGGTFDPIHVGHLDVALAAQRALGLSDVLVLPSNVPPHRARPFASAPHRFAMAALAVQDQDGLRVSDVELDGTGPSFTADTLNRLEARGLPASSVVFITGADAFRDIPSWKDYPALLDRCHFAVVSRPKCPAAGMRVDLPTLADRMVETPCAIPARPAIFLIEAPTAAVSSTDIRRRVEARLSIDGLVPPAVARHIAQHGLYGPTGEA